jgi:hypothetical protein
MVKCLSCGRELKSQQSIVDGMGCVCKKKFEAKMQPNLIKYGLVENDKTKIRE